MKRSFYALLLAASALVITSSCNNGLYDADPKTTNNGGNPLNPGGGNGNGNGNGNGTAADFPWSGTDPMSGKIDGNFQVFDMVAVFDLMGTLGVTGTNSAGNSMSVQVPTGTAPGVYPMSTSINASYSEGGSSVYGSNIPGGVPGKVYIEVNDATTIKGKFYFTGKDPVGGGTRVITEGYFNATK